MTAKDTRSAAENEPLVVFDVGNTNTVCGVWIGDELAEDLRLASSLERTADEYGALLLALLRRAGVDPAGICGVVIASVVPPLHQTFELLSRKYLHCEPLFVEVCRSATTIRSKWARTVSSTPSRHVSSTVHRSSWSISAPRRRSTS